MSNHTATLWHLTKNQRLRYLSSVIALVFAHGFLFCIPLLIKYAMDGMLDAGQRATWLELAQPWLGEHTSVIAVLWCGALVIVLLTAIAGLFQYLKGRWSAQASESITRRTREALFDHLQHLPCKFYDHADTGDLVQRCTSDVETIRNFLAMQVLEIAQVAIMLLLVTPVLIMLDPFLALVSIALFPVIIGFALVYYRRIKVLYLEVDEAEAAMTTVLQENLTGIRVVRAFARQDFENQKFAAKNALYRDRTNHLIRTLGSYWARSDLLCMSQTGITLFAGAWWVIAGHLSVGTLFAFMTYQAMVIWPVRQLGRVLTESSKAVVAIGRLSDILGQPTETGSDLSRIDSPPLAGSIEFDNLSFAFEQTPVLRNISFSVRAGETLALVGPPGSGKSTIVQLLLRLYDYHQGSILLDGKPLVSFERKQLRSQIGLVMQEPFLYSRSIANNLRVGRYKAPHSDIVKSANEASIHGPILEFQDGYDTQVGERGVTLSGGQRQRMAIARALLMDPAILVLDDALSAVDTVTERKILGSLKQRRGRHTTIIIAHRLSSVTHSDRVLVLENGQIAQNGSHDELIESSGPYRKLWEIQTDLESGIESDLKDLTEPAGGLV